MESYEALLENECGQVLFGCKEIGAFRFILSIAGPSGLNKILPSVQAVKSNSESDGKGVVFINYHCPTNVITVLRDADENKSQLVQLLEEFETQR